MADEANKPLKRSIGPFQLTLYALGSMLGSGIYGLIGVAAGQVGNAVWLSFAVALVVALLTALSYASLGSRYPHAGGAAYVAQRAYRSNLLSFVVGMAVILSGLTSIATQSQVFAANLAQLIGLDGSTLLALGFLLCVAGLVYRGISESMWVNVACTLVEAVGLLVVIGVGIRFWGSADLFEVSQGDDHFAVIIIQGSILTFFAFIGFEDTINVAEECKNPARTIPIGLVSAMILGAALYIAVAVTVVSVVSPTILAEAPSPLSEVISVAAPGIPAITFTFIALFAVANTALVNFVTASRLTYGMARQGLLPAPLASVHPSRRTPHIAILVLFGLLAPLILVGDIARLASATVLLLLLVFAIVNAALVILQRRSGEKIGSFEVPAAIPIAGTVLCSGLIVARSSGGDWGAPLLAGAMLLIILGCFFMLRLRARMNA